jgi:hypothetical protein
MIAFYKSLTPDHIPYEDGQKLLLSLEVAIEWIDGDCYCHLYAIDDEDSSKVCAPCEIKAKIEQICGASQIKEKASEG